MRVSKCLHRRESKFIEHEFIAIYQLRDFFSRDGLSCARVTWIQGIRELLEEVGDSYGRYNHRKAN